ncbi:MAG TPA: hypothetical protein VN026_13010 [Bacteroidia bacterium]|jgi:hypothetical protein|nr:hypothetical protein [Bacteroidia bacterium]
MRATRKTKIKYLVSMFFLCSIVIKSQNKKEITKNDSIIDLIDSLKEITPSIEVSSDYNSKVTFWGRDFGRKQFGFENNLIYKTGKGFFLSYTGYIWSAMPKPYAKTDIGLGYERQFTDRFYGSLGYERWFFNTNNSYVKKALANYIEANVNYDLGWINIEPSFYYMFGNVNVYQTDINLYSEINLFSFLKSGNVSLKPQWLTTLASQAFLPIYTDYPAGYVNENKFKLVDFEFSLPVSIKIKNLEFEPNFHYNIPVKINNEQISSFFYFSIHLGYNFYFSKGKIKKLYRLLN